MIHATVKSAFLPLQEPHVAQMYSNKAQSPHQLPLFPYLCLSLPTSHISYLPHQQIPHHLPSSNIDSPPQCIQVQRTRKAIREAEKRVDEPWTPELNYESWDPTLIPESTKTWLILNLPKESYSRLQRNIALDGSDLL